MSAGTVAAQLLMGEEQAAALQIAGTPVLTATEDEAYAGFTVTATGGAPPYVFSVASGALPTGITIDPDTGEVAGTPTVNGTFAGIVLRVTDDAPDTADLAAFTLEVAEPLEITGTPVLTATEGEAYTGFDCDATGGTAPYVFSLVGTWPDGITVNASTGEVSGTPTESGSFPSLSVRVTDDALATDDLASFTLEVDAASFQQVYANTLTANNNSWNGYTLRNVFTAGDITNPTDAPTTIRVYFEAGTTENLVITSAYVGHKAAAGDPYDFAAAPTQLLFSGIGSVTIPAGETRMGEAAFAYDRTSGLVIASYTAGGTTVDTYRFKSAAGINSHYKLANDPTTVNATGYTLQTGILMGINKIEMDGF